ncbi:DUF5412 family protein [Clostridium algidicarnis]|uniref:DUF5412 family protein n=1 Tax=Clostridium algidicarnis TaxID=37659 RepID=UPI001C0BD4FD|nr:DUF5412 family protein [Clostridium algidicarnis]MBU3210683.1 DUF5412 domain-containing protein [Clostridium algidicarnis]MBU3229134.1 DUF5412 domain-containing protein [Clostridium algidicarnis]MBU3252633.1 DUF5412 domain-containing protein [Clostridium algidicarnis]
MKKNKTIFGVVIISIVITILITIISFRNKNSYIDSIGHLPKGEYLSQSTSPNGTYTIRTYLFNGSATVDYAVRGELIINNKNKKPRNIYWEYKIHVSEITWDSDETVIINGHKIDLPNGKYDWRVDS